MAAPAHAADHSLFQTLLDAHVTDGAVDYAAIKADPSALRSYLRTLEQTSRTQHIARDRDDRLAFWINAYNAYTIEWVVDHYPTRSIRDTVPLWKRAFGGVFAERFIPLGHLMPGAPAEDRLSLDDIEHEVLRKHFEEPRIHFAIVCASRSCPALAGTVYTGARLEAQLDRRARAFIGDPTKNRYLAARHRLELSSIFRWFREDFERSGQLYEFVRPYLPEPAREAMGTRSDAPEIVFLDYDWSLNRQ